MVKRVRLKAWQHAPKKQSRFYVQPETSAKQVRRTIASSHNPFHDGLTEGRTSGASLSKRACTGLARNGSPHHNVVAVDWRTRKAERKLSKFENGLRKEERLLDQQLDQFLRKLEKAT